MDVSELKGKILEKIKRYDDVLIFHTVCGRKFKMYHAQECCEGVYIEDICGDLDDLIDSPIINFHESTNLGEDGYGTITWTFYNINTIKGSVTIRWHGSSNGYYSESVDFEEITDEKI
jgi:hypothetical protein